jgi:hypothetical protein
MCASQSTNQYFVRPPLNHLFWTLTSTTIDGGLKALKWSMKKYYTEYVEHIDAGEIWAAPSDGPLVRVAFFFDDGVILHDTWPYEEYIEWMTYDEDE